MAAAEKIVRQDASPLTLQKLQAKGNRARISEYGQIAEALDCPLWILFIPGLSKHPELMDEDGLKRIRKLVENYLASDERGRYGMDVFSGHCALNWQAIGL